MRRGFGTIELGLIVGALALLVAAWFGIEKAIDDARDEGVRVGREAALLEVAQRDNKQLTAALADVKRLEAEKAAAEQLHRDAMQAIDDQHQRDLANVHAEKDRVISDLRNGNLRLRNARGRADRGCAPGGESRPTGVAGAAGERDAAARGEPRATLEGSNDTAVDDAVFTIELLAEGDEAIADLAACQKIVENWRPRVHPAAP